MRESASAKLISETCGRPTLRNSLKMTRQSGGRQPTARGHDPSAAMERQRRTRTQEHRRSVPAAWREEDQNPGAKMPRKPQGQGHQRTSSLPGARGPWTQCRHGLGHPAPHRKPPTPPEKPPLTLMSNRMWRWVPRHVAETMGDLLNDSTHISQIAPTWAPIYQQGVFHYCPSSPSQAPRVPPLRPVPGAGVWSRWTTKSMALFLCSPNSLTPRQLPEVWKAFHSFNVPAQHKDFIKQVLWLRLPVGERQKEWKPDDVCCPIDGELETIDHARTECSLLKVAFDTIAKCFPTATAEEHPKALLSSTLQHSFQCPSGFLAWAAVYANWQVRQKKKHQRQYAATWTRFVSIWIATLKLWATCPLNIPISDHDLYLLIRALQSLLHDGVLQHPHLRVTPPTPHPAQQKATKRNRVPTAQTKTGGGAGRSF